MSYTPFKIPLYTAAEPLFVKNYGELLFLNNQQQFPALRGCRQEIFCPVSVPDRREIHGYNLLSIPGHRAE